MMGVVGLKDNFQILGLEGQVLGFGPEDQILGLEG